MNKSLTTAKNGKFLLHFVIFYYNYSKCYIIFMPNLYIMFYSEIAAQAIGSTARNVADIELKIVLSDRFVRSWLHMSFRK